MKSTKSNALLQKGSLMGRIVFPEDKLSLSSSELPSKPSARNLDTSHASVKLKVNSFERNAVEQVQVARGLLKPCKTSISGIGSSPSECSRECPFWQYDPAKACNFFCVAGEDCPNFGDPLQNFANATLMTCTACKVMGCARCGKSEHECSKCLVGYDLAAGKCFAHLRHIWWIVYGVLIFLVLLVLSYVVNLWARPNENNIVLREAIEYRHRSKERNLDEDDALYSLQTNLCSKFVSGVGVILHFRWQVCVIAWSLVVLLGTGDRKSVV